MCSDKQSFPGFIRYAPPMIVGFGGFSLKDGQMSTDATAVCLVHWRFTVLFIGNRLPSLP